jgi:hypothetical protein
MAKKAKVLYLDYKKISIGLLFVVFLLLVYVLAPNFFIKGFVAVAIP